MIMEQGLQVVQEVVDHLHRDLLELEALEILHLLVLFKVKMEEMVLQEQETLEVVVAELVHLEEMELTLEEEEDQVVLVLQLQLQLHLSQELVVEAVVALKDHPEQEDLVVVDQAEDLEVLTLEMLALLIPVAEVVQDLHLALMLVALEVQV